MYTSNQEQVQAKQDSLRNGAAALNAVSCDKAAIEAVKASIEKAIAQATEEAAYGV